MTTVLGIETSCDETGVARLVDGTVTLLADEVASGCRQSMFGPRMPPCTGHWVPRCAARWRPAGRNSQIYIVAATIGPGLGAIGKVAAAKAYSAAQGCRSMQ